MRLKLHYLCAAALIAWTMQVPADTPAGNTTGRTVIDRIVAVVNDDVITLTELESRLRSIKQQIMPQTPTLPPDNILEKQVLDRLIVSSIQLQLANKTGIRVDDETLNRTIDQIAADNKLTLSEFREVLEKDGYHFANFREDIRNEIIIARLRQREVTDRITVTEQEIDNFLANQAAQGKTNAEYHLAHILIAIPGAASPEQIQAARDKAEMVLTQLRAGADFQQTAITVSDGQQALQGGDLGWRKLGELPTLFVDAVTKMQTGDISAAIRSTSGFHIIKLLGQRSKERHLVTQTLARHILLPTGDPANDEKVKSRLEDLRQQIIDGADFAELARANSGDKATAANGGSLGWIKPGELPAEIEMALDGLSEGQITMPVKSRQGWHIVQVQERRREDDTTKFMRAQARESIRQRKIDEEQQLWLRRLRDEAYVENRLEAAPK